MLAWEGILYVLRPKVWAAMAGRRGRRGSDRKEWYTSGGALTDITSLASGATVAVIDDVLEHPTSGEDYGPGTLVGLRVSMTVRPEADLEASDPYVVGCLLPTGLATFNPLTQAVRLQNRRYIWWVMTMQTQEPTGVAAVYRFSSELGGWLHMATTRKFDRGDRFVVMLVNVDGAAFGAGAEGTYAVDGYIRPA